MGIEWLLLGLPIAFFLGWLAARLDISHVISTAKEYPRNLFEGFSKLLNGEKDKALSHLILASEKIPSNPLLFLIGDLAQKQGDFQRSMQIHQQLYDREDLSATERNRALWALTTDYYKIGFFDYAEEYALSLQNDAEYKQQAFDLLLEVYQRRRLYDKAIALTEGLPEHNPHHKTLSYFYCMRAESESDLQIKADIYNKALSNNPLCVPSQLALAASWLDKKEYKTAYVAFEAVEKQNPQFLWLVVDGLVESARGLGEEKSVMTILMRWLKDHPSDQLFKKIYTALITLQAEATDIKQVCESYFIQQKSFISAAFWLEQQQLGVSTRALMELKTMLMSASADQFTCQQCNYISSDFTWSCPGCLQWETLSENKN